MKWIDVDVRVPDHERLVFILSPNIPAEDDEHRALWLPDVSCYIDDEWACETDMPIKYWCEIEYPKGDE